MTSLMIAPEGRDINSPGRKPWVKFVECCSSPGRGGRDYVAPAGAKMYLGALCPRLAPWATNIPPLPGLVAFYIFNFYL